MAARPLGARFRGASPSPRTPGRSGRSPPGRRSRRGGSAPSRHRGTRSVLLDDTDRGRPSGSGGACAVARSPWPRPWGAHRSPVDRALASTVVSPPTGPGGPSLSLPNVVVHGRPCGPIGTFVVLVPIQGKRSHGCHSGPGVDHRSVHRPRCGIAPSSTQLWTKSVDPGTPQRSDPERRRRSSGRREPLVEVALVDDEPAVVHDRAAETPVEHRREACDEHADP